MVYCVSSGKDLQEHQQARAFVHILAFMVVCVLLAGKE